MTTGSALVERFVFAVDMQSYSGRNTRRQELAQQGLTNMLDSAAEEVDIGRERWQRQLTGDGEMAVLPADVDMATVVGPFVATLNTILAEYNDDHSPDTAIRLRLAVHVDTVLPSVDPTLTGAHRFPGPALIVASRLLDCEPLRRTLVEAVRYDGCELALIASQPVFEKVIQAGLRGIRPSRYRPVRVHIPEKRFDHMAYLYAPVCDVNSFTLDAPESHSPLEPDGSGAPPGYGVTQSFRTGDIHSEKVEFGNLHLGPASGR